MLGKELTLPMPWSEKELEILSELAKRRVPCDRIHEALPSRTPEAIRQMLAKRGLWKHYSPRANLQAYKELLRVYKG